MFLIDARFELLPLTEQHAEEVANIWRELKKVKNLAHQDWEAHRFDIVLCAIASATGYTLITDDTGQHLDVIAQRMRTKELETWLQNLE